MITNEQIRSIIEDCKNSGHEVKIRDIAFVLLTFNLEDINLIYTLIYSKGKEKNIKKYIESDSISFLKTYMESNYIKKYKKSELDITFEENKAYMLKLKKQIEDAMESGEMEKKDAFKFLTDISVKLNNNFQITEEVKEQMIIVNHKYNDICPYCHHEVSKRK